MKYFSTFSGIGGFELGIKQAYERRYLDLSRTKERKIQSKNEESMSDSSSENGDRRKQYPLCVGYSEIDKYAIQVYNKQFNHKNYGNITRIRTKDLPNFDLLVGGFPCQAFSIAGKRKGFDDTRGTLFFDLARILADKRPRNFVFENVKGLLSHEQGKTFQTILGVLSDLGYRVEWQVLNSKNFGVPQNRERVFIVGHLGGGSGQQIFPIGGSCREVIDKKTRSIQANCLTATCHKGAGSDGMTLVKIPEATKKGYAEMQQHTFIKNKIRRLTPRECERLQGFPDDWTKYGRDEKKCGCDVWQCEKSTVEISDTQRYKMCGNAVTTNVVESIINKLYK